ncbi:histidine--tRNA ligase [Mesoplasma syrphidae]|uniref:Histidine--tRNA ligase n=1 Tax=Mesoplasma syrphidae TaxID=225999 RepID=A0A2K9C5P5_9MOLU|nr:histidine--tRNA ligase [Mesoplasma syrphidae]AUF83607.1 histidine--tRNA ligase [Mesoplasma syrphidae]
MIQKPRGTQDIFGQDAKQWSALENKLKNILAKFNYSEIRTPIFEAKELFVRSVGETSDVVSKEMYELVDKKGREFVLRPEGTASIVRSLVENKLYAPEYLPFKVFYIGPMFRYERPQVGRNRQFHQLGIEAFGANSFNQDMEIIIIANQIVKELQLDKNLEIEINYLVTGDARIAYVAELKKYLQTFELCGDCQIRMVQNPLRILDCKVDGYKFTNIPDMNIFLSASEQTEFNNLINGLNNLGIKTVINPKLVRGLDYYTGFIFELKCLSEKLGGQQTIIAGGRYNNLVSELEGPMVPSAGFGMGLERLLIMLAAENISLATSDDLDVYTIAVSEKGMQLNQELLFKLRNAGIKADTDLMNRSFKSAFKQADKFKAHNVIVIGDKEYESRKLQVKNQFTKQNTILAIEELINNLKGE